ncbi:circularly permuted type 2 ATP-grasp protein [Roseibacillus persicicus]|nr:circularly permuted type 2 ATP-grasp protein [Roseibacillus persicicus]
METPRHPDSATGKPNRPESKSMPPSQSQTLGSMSQSQTSPTPGGGDGLFANYKGLEGSFDEFLDPDGSPRPTWQDFSERLRGLGKDGLGLSWRRGEELLRENGISYNLLGDQSQNKRPWNLDPIPALMSESEWTSLSASLVERAHLWNQILKDCYGPRTLLNEGLLPPALLYSQPNFNRFLPPVNGGGNILTSYAVDVARSADGTWTVVADRTEAPNGAGFALENRIILANVFPETTHKLHLIRQAAYFQSLRATLFAHAPGGNDEPKVVMLSPGPADRTYFEDAYLARYLGITLAVGEELTVRNDRVYLKTVSGLQRVHVIYRRVHETVIDPLEVPTNSQQGVPGLMGAIRSGTVSVINPPGTGIAESPALLPFLPAISQRLFGKDLSIPSIETIWGGQEENLLESLPGQSALLKEAFGLRLRPPVQLDTLPVIQRESLVARVNASPSSYVVQQQMNFSHGPVWTGSQLESRPLAYRFFLFAKGDSYQVMPGALVRCASSTEALPGLSLDHDSGSKDLWILGEKENPDELQTNQPARLSIRRSTGALSSRSADNLFWIGRYSERTEFATRVLLEIVLAMTDDKTSELTPLLATLRSFGYLTGAQIKALADSPSRQEILNLLRPVFFESASKESTGDSIPANVGNLFRLASLSRDRLSNESWRIIRAHGDLVSSSPPHTLLSMRPILQKALLNHSAFNGTCRENITRNQGWLFLNIGRRVERIHWLLTLINNLMEADPELSPSSLETALSINDTTLTYRFRYRGSPQPLPALDLILFDPANPRSLAFQLKELDRDLRNLPKEDQASQSEVPRFAHRIVLRAMNYLETELLSTDDETSEAAELAKLRVFLTDLQDKMPRFTEKLGWEFFTHVEFTNS